MGTAAIAFSFSCLTLTHVLSLTIAISPQLLGQNSLAATQIVVAAIQSLSLAVEYSYWKYHMVALAISVVISTITFCWSQYRCSASEPPRTPKKTTGITHLKSSEGETKRFHNIPQTLKSISCESSNLNFLFLQRSFYWDIMEWSHLFS